MINVLHNMNNKGIGIYMRKEKDGENLSTGYGRLQWLRYELEEYEGSIQNFIDDTNVTLKLARLLEEIFKGNIVVLLIWSIEDIDKYMFENLALQCKDRKVPIISFCESYEWINGQVEIIAEKSKGLADKKSLIRREKYD